MPTFQHSFHLDPSIEYRLREICCSGLIDHASPLKLNQTTLPLVVWAMSKTSIKHTLQKFYYVEEEYPKEELAKLFADAGFQVQINQ